MRTRLLILFLLAALTSAGCGDAGPATYAVSGVVRYEGKAVSGGNLTFVPDAGPAVVAAIDAEGRFELRAVAGRHRGGRRRRLHERCDKQ